MSGNPFRASQHLNHTAAAVAAPTTSFIHSDDNRADDAALETDDAVYASPLPARTKKSVRIESPTSSPPHPVFYDADDALAQRMYRGRHAGSPPPTSPEGSSDRGEDQTVGKPFDKEADSGENAHEAPGMTGSARRNPVMMKPVHTPSGVPANPFSRTLATIEGPEKDDGVSEQPAGQSRDRPSPPTERKGPRSKKGSLDVEGFKRLLMTGISSPSPSPNQPSQPASTPNSLGACVFESSSSTDTSSVSRQSIFEPVQEPLVETPRTSHEMARSDDDDRVGLAVETKRIEKKKPPPPKHRHGRLVQSRTPQTVSFSDFSPSAMTEPPSPSPSRNRTNSDLNKPLPSPPALSSPAHIVSQDTSQDEAPPLETRISESSSQSEPPVQKKMPPPVPIARRQSQLRTSVGSNRSRSNSQLTTSSQHSVELPMSPGSAIESFSQSQANRSPPPPPPSRRHGAPLAGIGTSSADSSTTELPTNTVSASSRRSTLSLPDPPPSRKAAQSLTPSPPDSGPARQSSVRSNRTPRSVSNESVSMPPPPPPPRRKQSGRSSVDKERPHLPPGSSPPGSRRTSSDIKRDSFDDKRRISGASESSLRNEYARAPENEQAPNSPEEEMTRPRTLDPTTPPKENPANILDDMDKFQQEIDALRERYRRAS